MNRKFIEDKLQKHIGLNKNYFTSLGASLIPGISKDLFYEEIIKGNGSELKGDKPKFYSISSSCALAVNSFAFWKNHIKCLSINNHSNFLTLSFEKKLKNGLRGFKPNLDIVLENDSEIIAIESKFLEIFNKQEKNISKQYLQISDHRSKSKWFNIMKQIYQNDNTTYSFRYLNIVQLIKHFFGICKDINNKQKILYYIFWEPLNANTIDIFKEQRKELEIFYDEISGDKLLKFKYISYPELWAEWKSKTNNSELLEYIKYLEERYLLSI